MGTMEKTDPQKESKRWKWSGWFSLLNNIFKSDRILEKTFRQRVPPTEATGTPATASLSPPQLLGPSLQKDHWASWSLQNDKIMLTICSTPKKHPATSVPLGANADPRSRSICWHSLKCSIARSIITMSLSIYLGRAGKDPMLPTTKTTQRSPQVGHMYELILNLRSFRTNISQDIGKHQNELKQCWFLGQNVMCGYL